MSMKNLLYTTILLFASFAFARAQEVPQQLQNPSDSLQMSKAPLADSSLVGKTIFQLLGENGNGGSVQVNQPAQMDEAYARYVKANSEKKRSGYRIRLFFDNKQSARFASDTLEQGFQLRFPQIPTYRTYNNPFFKVTVGDYRTKSDAIRQLNRILPFYPQAIVVRETIWFPEI